MFKELFKSLLFVCCCIFITACNHATTKKSNEISSTAVWPNAGVGCVKQVNADLKIKLDLIQQLIDKGSLFAALAHLDSLRSNDPQAIYLRAEILRRTERSDQASTLYQSLLLTCKSGKGYHGLGLIAGRNNDISLALNYLKKAVYELPLDVRARNDYGYALLLNGQYDLARYEFMTAYELSGGDRLAKTNMVLLMFVTEQEDQVRSFIDGMGLDEETVRQLQAEAKRIKPTPIVKKSKPALVEGFRPVFTEDIPSYQSDQSESPQPVKINPVFQEETPPALVVKPIATQADGFKPGKAEDVQPTFADENESTVVEETESEQVKGFKPAHAESMEPVLGEATKSVSESSLKKP